MTTFDADLVGRWFDALLDPRGSAEHSEWLELDGAERRVLADGGRAVAAAVAHSALPGEPAGSTDPAVALLQVYLTGLATGVAGARQNMTRSGEPDTFAAADRLCLVAGLIAGGAAVAVEPGPAVATGLAGTRTTNQISAADLATAAGTAAAELVVDGADLHAITSAAAAAALLGGPPDGANRDPAYRARALISAVLVGLQRSTAPAGTPVRPPSCGARPGVNGGAELFAEVTFTMFLDREDSDRLTHSLRRLADEVVLWSEGDRRSFHVHTRKAGEVIAECYAVGTVFSLVVGRLD